MLEMFIIHVKVRGIWMVFDTFSDGENRTIFTHFNNIEFNNNDLLLSTIMTSPIDSKLSSIGSIVNTAELKKKKMSHYAEKNGQGL